MINEPGLPHFVRNDETLMFLDSRFHGNDKSILKKIIKDYNWAIIRKTPAWINSHQKKDQR
ncbi:MAG: hypothetical protein ACD_2C00141G0013 [uncultured bacterium (gcode 4)]|uniref:Uncharacterized protein n=1 Tax=uncultured bacterium (gcode 4) TaxID=1234023 RepID=K2FEI2_9BACT|nr:MAG: hypothetical protein ACD_2C00141G0013 [uncultured bacterium (gcode 4)]